MRVPTTKAFNQFLMANSQRYPYNSLQATRASFFCKWIMLKGRSAVTGLTEYFPTLANSYSNGVLLEMISNGDGKPLPPELSHIMDSMNWWGIKEDLAWYDNVVFILSRSLDIGVVHNKKDYVRNLISLQITKLIEPHYDMYTLGFDLLLVEWVLWFDHQYKVEDFDGDFCFRWIAIKSFDQIEAIIREQEVLLPVTSS